MRISDIAPEQQAARIRAAIGYSGEEINEVARQLGVSPPTLWRRTNRQKPTGAKSLDELYAIADICGVPRRFMEAGFDDLKDAESQGDLPDRMTRVEARLATLAEIVEERLAALVEQALAPAGEPAASADHPQAASAKGGRTRGAPRPRPARSSSTRS